MSDEQKAAKTSKFDFNIKIDLSTLLLAGAAMYFMYSAHSENMENTKKMQAIITKYETQLDNMIAEDKKSLADYKRNLKSAMSSLSKEEQQLLKQVFAIENK